jgi:hypothetical protein
VTAARKRPLHPVTPPAREAFLLYVHTWADRLGLQDWRITVSAKPAAKANMAEVHEVDYEARLAVLRIGEDFGSAPVNDESIEETALHEVLHVFLKELIYLASDQNLDDDVLNSAEHRVIHSLIRALKAQ